MKPTHRESLIYLFLTLLFLTGSLSIHNHSRKNMEEDIAYQAEAIVSYIWELDFKGVAEYLSLAAKTNHYKAVWIYDSYEKIIQVQIEGPEPGALDRGLIKLDLIPTKEITKPINYENNDLGELTVIYYNTEIYRQGPALLLLVLSLLIAYLLIHLARARAFLEEKVQQRTRDLENEIHHRIEVENDLRLTLDSIGDGVITADLNERVIRMNPVAQSLTGWEHSQAKGKLLNEILVFKEDLNTGKKEDPVNEILSKGRISISAGPRILVSRTGEEFRIAESGAPIRSESGKVTGVVLVIRDISEEYKLQVQLEHSQRMDAVGQLAGGVAHDFNNMLGGIIGSAELLSGYLTEIPEAEEINKMIIETSERAAALTNQLLTFSRKQKVISSPVDLHGIIKSATTLLERTIDRRVTIQKELKAESSTIIGDPAMLQNTIINLGINAGHAMPGGGVLYIRTSTVYIDEEYCKTGSFEMDPGEYIKLTVEDEGSGIPAERLPHLFDPFFTTKEPGKGTGLGLAAVYGSVKQHRGEIKVYSELNAGTSFTLLFPLSHSSQTLSKDPPPAELTGSGTILIVDDEEIMRRTARGILESLGYSVLSASNGKDAVALYQQEKADIILVILDMVMPVMTGHECFELLRSVSPSVPVILASGFTNTEILNRMKKDGLNGFISKPYHRNELGRLIREVLESTSLNTNVITELNEK